MGSSPFSFSFTSTAARYRIPVQPPTKSDKSFSIRYVTIHFLDRIGYLSSVTENAPKSPFFCVNRDPIGYGFRAGERAIRSGLKKRKKSSSNNKKERSKGSFFFLSRKGKSKI